MADPHQLHAFPFAGQRLLFVSLDGGYEKAEDAKDVVGRRKDVMNPEQWSRLRNAGRGHWYWTNRIALELLKGYHDAKMGAKLTLDDARSFFAHTPSAKCCENNERGGKARPKLFSNCREFIPGEVAVLNPDVVITQGSEARKALDTVDILDQGIETLDGDSGPYDCQWKVIKAGSTKSLWFPMYHPTYFGGFHKQMRNCLPF